MFKQLRISDLSHLHGHVIYPNRYMLVMASWILQWGPTLTGRFPFKLKILMKAFPFHLTYSGINLH